MKHIKDINLFESVKEYIDHKSVNLKSEFDHINKRLFDGKVKPVQLRWMNSKNTIGLMSYNDDHTIKDIAISYYFKMTLQDFRNVMAHEMIHAYLEQMGVKERDAHGPRFMRMREDINNRFPEYKVVKSENADDFEPSSYARLNKYGAAIFQERGDTYSLMVFPEQLVDDKAEVAKFEEQMRRLVMPRLRDPKITLCKSDYPDLAKFKFKKSLAPKSMELYAISPEQAKSIIERGEIILELTK